jgi:hypothetical protein
MEVMSWPATSWEVFLHRENEAAKRILDSFRSIEMGVTHPSLRKEVAIEESLCHGSIDIPLFHLDRSEAQWRDLCVDALCWKCFED